MYFEIAYESRRWVQNREGTTQTFIYYVCNEDLDEDDNVYGEFFSPNDDVGLANFIYNNFPDSREFVAPSGDITLYINEISAVQKLDDGWEVTITYSLPEQQNNPNYVQFGFSTNGETTHISRAISVKSSVARTGSTLLPPETHGLIGVGKNNVEGMDITDPGLAFNITAYFDPSIWSTSIMLTLAGLTKTYNNASFYGFSAGEVLFDYCDAQGEAFKFVPVTFYFIYKPNISAASDSPFPSLTMLGHDILDYLYANEVSNSQQIMLPVFRNVLQVRNPGNFDLLGV